MPSKTQVEAWLHCLAIERGQDAVPDVAVPARMADMLVRAMALLEPRIAINARWYSERDALRAEWEGGSK